MPKARFKLYATAQIFSWTDPDGSRSIDFFIEPLLHGIANGSLAHDSLETELDFDWITEWLSQRELNMDHVAALTASRIDVPVLGAWMEDGSVLLIDGGHRYMARYLRGLSTIRYHIVSKAVWNKYAKITQL